MSRPPRLKLGRGDLALIALASALLLLAWRPVAHDETATASSKAPIHRAVLDARVSEDSLDAAQQRVVLGDPFRMAATAGPSPTSQLGPPAGPFASPPLRGVVIPVPATGITLKALAGPPWMAVIAGLPGQPGQTVLTVGDTAGAFRVTAIRRDTVILHSRDSTVRLALPKEVR